MFTACPCGTNLEQGDLGLEPVNKLCSVCANALLQQMLESHPEVADEDQLELPVHNHGIDPSCKEEVINGRLVGECIELGDETGG